MKYDYYVCHTYLQNALKNVEAGNIRSTVKSARQ
jgi:hypothetical protein